MWVLQAPPPPPLRSSPESDGEIDFVAVDPKSMVTDAETVGGPALSLFIISLSLPMFGMDCDGSELESDISCCTLLICAGN